MNNFQTNYPFNSYGDQRKKLIEEKNLIIDNERLLEISLKNYNYYTIINGYKDLFLDPKALKQGKESFKPGTTFSMLYQAHWMDITMSNILFKYTLLVEKKLKTRISYLLAKIYGVNEADYLREKNYSAARHHKGKIKMVIEQINKNRDKDISAQHYMAKEDNLPPWIAAKAISFGDTFIWYQALNGAHKSMIVKEFLNPCPFMKSEDLMDFFYRALGQVYEYRNLSAHGNRTFRLIIPEKFELKSKHIREAKLDDLFSKYDYQNRNNLYSIIISILILIDDPFALENFHIELRNFFSAYDKDVFLFIDKDVYDLFDLPRFLIDDIETYIRNREIK